MKFREDLMSELSITINDEQLEKFHVYYQYLIEYNKITNLTRITEKNDVFYKHFFDSLTLAKSVDIKAYSSLCDMGSGAGFPSIPLKIIYPHLKITIVDSLNKRITFLSNLVDKLNLEDVELVHDRVENFATNHQMHFDLVTARALGHLSLITEMGMPMLKKDGYFIGLKAKQFEDELNQAKSAIATLGGQIENIHEMILPHDYGYRVHILIKKARHIKGYPRSYVNMTKKPL